MKYQPYTHNFATLASYLRTHIVDGEGNFSMLAHEADGSIADGLDTILCNENPSNEEPNSDAATFGISGYTLEQALDDCVNQNPVMDLMITQIGGFSDLDIKQIMNGEFDWDATYANAKKVRLIVEYMSVMDSDGLTSSLRYSRLALLNVVENRDELNLVRIDDCEEGENHAKFVKTYLMEMTPTQIENIQSGTEVNIEALNAFRDYNNRRLTDDMTRYQHYLTSYINSNAAVTTSHLYFLSAYYEGAELPSYDEITFGDVSVQHKDGNFVVAEAFETEINEEEGRVEVTIDHAEPEGGYLNPPKPHELLTVKQLLSGDVTASYYCGDDSDMLTPKKAYLHLIFSENLFVTIPAIAE